MHTPNQQQSRASAESYGVNLKSLASPIVLSAIAVSISLSIYLTYLVTSSSSPETIRATTTPVDPALAQAEQRVAQLQTELAVLRNERDLFREQFDALQQKVQQQRTQQQRTQQQRTQQQRIEQQRIEQQQATPVFSAEEYERPAEDLRDQFASRDYLEEESNLSTPPDWEEETNLLKPPPDWDEDTDGNYISHITKNRMLRSVERIRDEYYTSMHQEDPATEELLESMLIRFEEQEEIDTPDEK